MRISHAELIGLVDYDPLTGAFRARIHLSPKVRAGALLGCIDKSNGYRRIKILGVNYKASRLAWFYVHGEWPIAEIDHINLVRDDDRIDNLRSASRSQNEANKPKRAGNTSPLKGASFHRQTGRWQARIRIDGKNRHLGLFDTDVECHAAYCEAATNLYGQFARTS